MKELKSNQLSKKDLHQLKGGKDVVTATSNPKGGGADSEVAVEELELALESWTLDMN